MKFDPIIVMSAQVTGSQISKVISDFFFSFFAAKPPNGQVVCSPHFRSQGPGLNPAGGRIQLMTVRRFFAQSQSLSSFHCIDMT